MKRINNLYNKVLAEKFGCSIHAIESKGFKFRLKKTPELIAEMARENMKRPDHPAKQYWITPGTKPPNAGKKQIEYMTQEAIERTKATRFQSGQQVWNHKPVGYERLTQDGYIEVKTAEPNIFTLKHRLIYEKHYGAIPAGHNIQFKDKNRQNCAIENLYIISRRDQLVNENSIIRYPLDLRKAIFTLSKLNKTINNSKDE